MHLALEEVCAPGWACGSDCYPLRRKDEGFLEEVERTWRQNRDIGILTSTGYEF